MIIRYLRWKIQELSYTEFGAVVLTFVETLWPILAYHFFPQTWKQKTWVFAHVQVRKSLEEDPAWKHVLRLRASKFGWSHGVGGFLCMFWVKLPKVTYISYIDIHIYIYKYLYIVLDYGGNPSNLWSKESWLCFPFCQKKLFLKIICDLAIVYQKKIRMNSRCLAKWCVLCNWGFTT